MSAILIVPGLNGSGPQHWQTWFEQKLSGCVRVEQRDWATPHLPRWAGAVRDTLDRAAGRSWIVAHSFGCLASVYAAAEYHDRIAGAMLVAPADPEKFELAPLLPAAGLAFPSVVVASANDPWMSATNASYWAARWGSRLISLGAAGHINPDSGFGPWAEGLQIFEHLRAAEPDSLAGSP